MTSSVKGHRLRIEAVTLNANAVYAITETKCITETKRIAKTKNIAKQNALQASLTKDQDSKGNNLVKYLLIADQKKMPIKKADISKNVLEEDDKAFPQMIKEAGKRLASVFGIELKELEDIHRSQLEDRLGAVKEDVLKKHKDLSFYEIKPAFTDSYSKHYQKL